MQYNFDFNGLLMPRRISFPMPDNLSIEAGMVNFAKLGLYSSILKQIEIYKRMDDDGMESGCPVSMLGTPVFSDITIESISNNQLSIKIDTALIVIDQIKNIGRTIVNGRSGSVKEYYALGDYDITLSGSITDENPTKYPLEQMRILRQLVELPESLKVNSPFLSLFDIFNVVVYQFKFDQKPASQNRQFFEIKMYSDTPVELEKVN